MKINASYSKDRHGWINVGLTVTDAGDFPDRNIFIRQGDNDVIDLANGNSRYADGPHPFLNYEVARKWVDGMIEEVKEQLEEWRKEKYPEKEEFTVEVAKMVLKATYGKERDGKIIVCLDVTDSGDFPERSIFTEVDGQLFVNVADGAVNWTRFYPFLNYKAAREWVEEILEQIRVQLEEWREIPCPDEDEVYEL